MDYKLSNSTIKLYNKCHFAFYCKLTSQPQDTQSDNTYGNAGNVVHKTIEHYYKHLREIEEQFMFIELKNFFNSLWDEVSINNLKVNKDEYWLCVINAIKLNMNPTHLEYEFKFTDPVNFIGYLDVMNINENWIGDWKTSSFKSKKVEEYRDQLLLYAYCYYREFGRIPLCWVYFNKSNRLIKFNFKEELIKKVPLLLKQIKDEIDSKIPTNDFKRTPGKNNCFFCNYKEICSSDLLREQKAVSFPIIFHLKNEKLLVEGAIPDDINRKIEGQINFEKKNAYFIEAAMKAKGVLDYKAIKILYRRKDFGAQTFQGYMHKIYNILNEYAISKGMKVTLTIKEYRNQTYLNQKIMDIPDLKLDFTPFPWQLDAVKILIKKRWASCEVGTGGGKTYIAAECIRQIGGKTIFIIDNKDLLLQTKTEYEKMLGIKCGIVGMSKREWEMPIILATIQTLSQNLKTFASKLAQFNVAIYDECHQSASKSYENLSKFLINTKYRLGFSATCRRNDLEDNIIFAHTGEIQYKKPAKELIEEGVLVNPEVNFHKYPAPNMLSDSWQNEYVNGIVLNEPRNKLIQKICLEDFKDKQIMILVKDIKNGHAQNLKDLTSGELIYGQTEDDIRFDLLEDFKNKKFRILVGSIAIFNKGINIKVLDVLINAAGNAGEVTTIQSIGRALRKSPGKDKAYYVDFFDKGEYLYKHSISRMNALKNEGYEVLIK